MQIKVNGEKLSIDKTQIDINELLKIAKAEQPEYVTVQLNGELIDHGGFAENYVKDGDEVEFLYFMGGGSDE